jgi:ribosome maturation factor RimP
VTRQLQYVLEVERCDYARLEVSSPGLDRPLKREADYARFAGAAIDLTLKLPLAGRKKFKGVLSAREGGGWRLAMEPSGKGAPEQALDFVFDEVREARLVPVIDFKGRKAREVQEEKQQ